MRIRTTFTTLAAALALVALTACSSSDTSTPPAFNQADVSFAQDMIPHHRQATEMASMAQSRTQSPAVRDLAQQILAAQEPEITEMNKWLKSWDKNVPEDMTGMSGMSDSSMPGMMSSADMEGLAASSGGAFDKQFLTMMIEHHEGAIEMAQTEDADGKYPPAVRLAKQIQKGQSAEIRTMRSLLES
ncbi:DUF305 domain-containing protein [Aeromicrobium sp.]|uniref:DUF305 domain-containing protein n=1 Tax=Aeromicrobium sp. TaxID=1871063 RepID=UPI003C37D3C6